MPADTQTSTTRGQLDLGGAVLVTAAMLVFVRAIVIAPEAGWLSAQTLVSFGLAVALMAGFVAVERRVERPLVRLGIFRSALLVRANLGSALLFGGATAFNVVNTLYLQDVLGWSPLETGLAFMASSLVTAFVGPRAGALASRVGADLLAAAGGLATLLASMNEGPVSSPSPVRCQIPDILSVKRRVNAGRVKRLSKSIEVNSKADGA